MCVKTTVRLPQHLNDQIAEIAKFYSPMSKNDIIINAVIAGLQMFKVPPLHLVNGSNVPPPPEPDTETKVPPPNGGKTEPSSRAPYKHIYKLYNNNKLDIYIDDLRAAWDDFVQYRKESKKPVKPTQMKHLWERFESILDEKGVEGLIASIKQTIERGYQGVFLADNNVIEKVHKQSTTEEDF